MCVMNKNFVQLINFLCKSYYTSYINLIFITFWYDKVSIKINKSISYEQAPLLLFKMSSVTLVNFTATSQTASHSYHIIKCSLCLVLLQYASYSIIQGRIILMNF